MLADSYVTMPARLLYSNNLAELLFHFFCYIVDYHSWKKEQHGTNSTQSS